MVLVCAYMHRGMHAVFYMDFFSEILKIFIIPKITAVIIAVLVICADNLFSLLSEYGSSYNKLTSSSCWQLTAILLWS